MIGPLTLEVEKAYDTRQLNAFAAAEGLVMGASFPELTSHLYKKDFDAGHPAIVEMKAHGVAAADEIGEPDIDRRTGVVLRKLKKFAFWL